MKKTQCVMTADLARYLIMKGFNIIDLDQHRNNPTATVFIFAYSQQLQEAMDLYFDFKSTNKKHA
jgi:hypothetical protein